ncbi:MAG: four helix bundle protein [Patescibacteria group bacterium]
MTNQNQNPNIKKTFDLKEKTAQFGEIIIKFAKSLPNDFTNRPIISQLIRSATSIGANYMEAVVQNQKKIFVIKLEFVKKNRRKQLTGSVRMIACANQDEKGKCRKLWKEAHELTLIFSTILKNK